MPSGRLERCAACGSARLDPVASFGSSPPPCAMPRVGERRAEVSYPLDLVRCGRCTLVQLAVVPDPAEVFPPDYPYTSGTNAELRRNFAQLAREVYLEPGDLIVDVGANDGTLLRNFRCRTVGVEPTRQAEKIDGPAYQEPFTEELARRIVAEHGAAKVVTACNVLAHVEDIGDVMRGIRHLLFDRGLLLAENGDLDAMIDSGAWDFVYHEHLRYYSPHSFHRLCADHGFGWQAWERTPVHGGSFRVWARKGGRDLQPPTPRAYDFGGFQRRAWEDRRKLRALADGVWGIGATARASTVINYCGLDVEDVRCVCELPGSDKIGRLIPGTRIPVVSEEELFIQQPSAAILFSWHLADLIVPKLRERGYLGEIIIPPSRSATHAPVPT